MRLQPVDSTKAVYYYESAFYYNQKSLPDSFIYFATRLLGLGRKTNNAGWMADYNSLMVSSNNLKNLYDSAVVFAREQLTWALKSANPDKIAMAFNSVGNTHIYLSNHDSAIIYLLRGLAYVPKMVNQRLPVNMMYNLSAAYSLIGNTSAAIHHAKKAYEGAAKLNDAHLMFNSMFNWATMEVKSENLDTALIMFNQLATLSKHNGDDYAMMDVLNNIGDIYYRKNNFRKSLQQYEVIAGILKKHNEPEYALYLYMNRGNTYLALGRYQNAQRDLLKATEIANKLNANYELSNIYQFRSLLKEKTNQFGDALRYHKMSDSLRQITVDDESRKNIQQLEVRYQTAQKDLAISQQKMDLVNKENAIRRKSSQNTALLIGCGLLVLVLFLAYRNIRHRKNLVLKERELHQSEIEGLRRKHQVEAMQSLLQGQDAERRRMAKDLHDGIGGLLSGIKFGLSGFERNNHLTEENKSSVSTLLGRLDDASAELRRVSHNLMPEALTKFGLKEAVENYCENIGISGTPKIQLQLYGMEQRFPQEKETSLYRIIQELLNNVIKHADAKSVLIQLTRRGNNFSLTVEDDGKGFEWSRVNVQKSAGLINVKSRTELMNASMDVHSSPGKGTSITIIGPVDS